MYHLHVLGTPQLTRIQSGDAVAVGRQGMALLAALAVAGPRGLTRERIAALFWDESDERQAAQSLRQLLYRLRKHLGESAIQGDHSLSLSAELIAVDLWRFRISVSAGDPDSALAAHGGPLLDGFHLSGSRELEEWVEDERSRVAIALRQLLGSARDRAASAGDHAAALRWSARLQALDPLSTEIALRHAALLRSEDLTEAIRFLRDHANLVAAEFGGIDGRVADALASLDALKVSTPPPRTDSQRTPTENHTEPILVDAGSASGSMLRPRALRPRAILFAGVVLLIGKTHPGTTDSIPPVIYESTDPIKPLVIEFSAVPSADSISARIAARAAERALWSFRQSEGWAEAFEPRDLAPPREVTCRVRFVVHRSGDTFVLRGFLANADGRNLIEGRREFEQAQSEHAIGEVRDGLVDQLVLRYHPRFRSWLGAQLNMRPEAARPFARALEAMNRSNDPFAGTGWLAEAIERDPAFHLAKLLFIEPHLVPQDRSNRIYGSERPDLDPERMLEDLLRRRDALPVFERAFLDVLEEFAQSVGWERRIVALRKWEAVAPNSIPVKLRLARGLFAGRRATEALTVLDAVPPAEITPVDALKIHILRTAALHALERYDDEYAASQHVRRVPGITDFELLPAVRLSELRAQAAKGLGAEVERRLDSAMANPTGMFGIAEALVIADELNAHGSRLAGNRVRQALLSPEMLRTIERMRPLPDQSGTDQRDLMAAYLTAHAGHFDVAERILARNVDHMPESLLVHWNGLRGVVAAQLGDTARAEIQSSALKRCRQWRCGEAVAWRARIAFASNRFKEGTNLLREAFASGFPYTVELHSERSIWPVWRTQHKVMQVW